jgi:hypothetical protein
LEKPRQNRRGVALGTGQMTKFLLPCMSPLLAQSGHWPFEFAVMHNRSGGVVGFKLA